MNFKKGDRVVYINKNSKVFNGYYGNVFTLSSPLSNSSTNWKVEEVDGGFTPHKNNLVLEEIWNSPLFQAMREDEND